MSGARGKKLTRGRWTLPVKHMGIGALRVFNDDMIVAGAEWPLHPHQDIESLTYVEAEFLHADSLGNNGRVTAGAAQVMT